MQCLCPIRVLKKKDLARCEQYYTYAPCGQCIACRLNYGKLWSIRMMEELKNHDKACFATLTYDDNHLPSDHLLCKRHLQLFWKLLRKKCRVRYFACGEYGDKFCRPHYHAIIYGVSPTEVDLVESCWPHGHVKLGNVTEDSCAYVAKYMTKKLNGKALKEKLAAEPDYQNEFVLMSRRPGIGGEPSAAMIKFMQENGIYFRKGIPSGLPRFYKEKFNIKPPQVKKHLINEVNADKLLRKRLQFFKRKG